MHSWSTSVVLLWLYLHGVCIGKELGKQVVHQLLIRGHTHNIFPGHTPPQYLPWPATPAISFQATPTPRPATPAPFQAHLQYLPRPHPPKASRPHLHYLSRPHPQYLPRSATPAISLQATPTISSQPSHTCNTFPGHTHNIFQAQGWPHLQYLFMATPAISLIVGVASEQI